MKSLSLFILLTVALISPLFIYAQSTIFLKNENKATRISTPQLNVIENEFTILLEMAFNAAVPRNKLSKVKLNEIETISLVYSKFKLNQEFDQVQLNASRLEKLYASIPGLSNNKNIKWYWIEQTGCNNAEDCNNLFHGFVITLKKTDEMREMETPLLDYYTKMYEGSSESTEELDSAILNKKLPFVKICDTIEERQIITINKLARIFGFNSDVKKKLNKKLRRINDDFTTISLQLIINTSGKFQSLNPLEENKENAKIIKLLNSEMRILPARYSGKKIQTKATVNIKLEDKNTDITLIQTPVLPDSMVFNLDRFLYKTTSTIKCEYIDTSKGKLKIGRHSTPDVVLRAFNRNKHWENCLVATDVTGSMYPYLAQFKAWHGKNLDNNKGNHDFVFFNDGNNKPDHTKVTGAVGGNYYIKTNSKAELFKTMNTSMMNGGGGDGPENNIEAVIEGLKMNNKLKAVIMIADNYATPRDLELLNQVKVPIRLIVCGAYNGINTAYLEMVRKNKGSIHTMEDDLLNLFELKETDTFILDGIKYIIENGSIRNLHVN
jgi:hypothetical protein